MDTITKLDFFVLFLKVASRQTEEKPKMQDDSFLSDEPVWIGGVDECVRVCVRMGYMLYFYGVCAMPRLDFIFSSLLERWLLFDSSSSTLSSAERNYQRVEREHTAIKTEPVK